MYAWTRGEGGGGFTSTLTCREYNKHLDFPTLGWDGLHEGVVSLHFALNGGLRKFVVVACDFIVLKQTLCWRLGLEWATSEKSCDEEDFRATLWRQWHVWWTWATTYVGIPIQGVPIHMVTKRLIDHSQAIFIQYGGWVSLDYCIWNLRVLSCLLGCISLMMGYCWGCLSIGRLSCLGQCHPLLTSEHKSYDCRGLG